MTRSHRLGTNPGTFHVQLDTAFLDPADIPDPIGRMFAEHYRARALCRILNGLADDPLHPSHQDAAWIVGGYLAKDHGLHVADEVDGLIPLLRLRRPSDAELEDACSMLAKQHDRDLALGRLIIGDLRLMADRLPPRLPLNFIVAARSLAENMARHLTWENSYILPLARRWLAPMDLAALDRDMRLRRQDWVRSRGDGSAGERDLSAPNPRLVARASAAQ